MILRVNGEDKTFSPTITTVHQLLDVLEINPKLAAVEINGEIVDPQLFKETTLHEKDKIEIVSFVGGG
jgi:thiamine biosynthesis protein ThiS